MELYRAKLSYWVDPLIIQDSYWFVDGEDDAARIAAICPICAKEQKKGWLWDKSLGYGDYDLFCSSCRNAIHLRGKVEARDKDRRPSMEGRGMDS